MKLAEMKEMVFNNMSYEQYILLCVKENELVNEMRYSDMSTYFEIRSQLDCVKATLDARVGSFC